MTCLPLHAEPRPTTKAQRVTVHLDVTSSLLAPHRLSLSDFDFSPHPLPPVPIYCMCTSQRCSSPTPGVPGAHHSVFHDCLIVPPHSLTRSHVYHAWHRTSSVLGQTLTYHRIALHTDVGRHPYVGLARLSSLVSLVFLWLAPVGSSASAVTHVIVVVVILSFPHLTIIRGPLHIPQSRTYNERRRWQLLSRREEYIRKKLSNSPELCVTSTEARCVYPRHGRQNRCLLS